MWGTRGTSNSPDSCDVRCAMSGVYLSLSLAHLGEEEPPISTVSSLTNDDQSELLYYELYSEICCLKAAQSNAPQQSSPELQRWQEDYLQQEQLYLLKASPCFLQVHLLILPSYVVGIWQNPRSPATQTSRKLDPSVSFVRVVLDPKICLVDVRV